MTNTPDMSFLPGDWSGDDLTPEQKGLAKVGTLLAAVVDNALRPALAARRIYSCLHAVDEANGYPQGGTYMRRGEERAVGLQPLLCPMHPDRLLCTKPDCIGFHYQDEHRDEHRTATCFACPMPIGHDSIFVNAAITLHRPIKLCDAACEDFYFKGTLMTTPVLYLCPAHAGLVQAPIRMAWPTDATDVSPQDAG